MLDIDETTAFVSGCRASSRPPCAGPTYFASRIDSRFWPSSLLLAALRAQRGVDVAEMLLVGAPELWASHPFFPLVAQVPVDALPQRQAMTNHAAGAGIQRQRTTTCHVQHRLEVDCRQPAADRVLPLAGYFLALRLRHLLLRPRIGQRVVVVDLRGLPAAREPLPDRCSLLTITRGPAGCRPLHSQ